MSEQALAIPGAGGDGGGAAPPVDTAPVETVDTAVETTPVDTSVETPDQPAVESTAPETTEDGRTIPLKYRDIFKANPELRSAFFTLRAFNEQFPNVAAAKEAREFIEEVGGREGWQEIQNGREQQAALDEKYYSRNPQGQREFIKNLVTQDKGAFVSMVPVALDEFYQADAKGYNRVMSRVVANTFAGAFNRMGVQNYLAQALQILPTNPDQAKQMLTSIGEWMGQFEQIASQQPEVDPDREAFENEKKEWQSQKDKDAEIQFNQSYKIASGQQAGEAALRFFEEALGAERFKSVDEEKRSDMIGVLFKRINATAVLDKNYMRQLKAFLTKKDAAGARKVFLNKFNSLLLTKGNQTLTHFGLSGPKPKPASGAPAAGAQPAPKAGWITLSKAPAPKDIARPATTDEMIMRNEAILRDGKKVRWASAPVA